MRFGIRLPSPSFPAVHARALTLLVLAFGVLASCPARADKGPPVSSRVEGPLQWLLAGERTMGTPLCQMGETDTSVLDVNFITPPNDAYYTLLRVGQCPSCLRPDTVLAQFAHMVLNFPFQCTVDVQVSIVAAAETEPGCLAPDTNVVLCPPRMVQVEPMTAGFWDLAFPLAAGCPIARDAFLCITFMGLGPECQLLEDHPRLVMSSQCGLCESYNDHDGTSGRTRLDLCRAGFNGRLSMYADGGSCVTPALVRTWGSLKVLYR